MCYYLKWWQISPHLHWPNHPSSTPSHHPSTAPVSPLRVPAVVMSFWPLLISQLRPCHLGDPWTNHQDRKRRKRSRRGLASLNGWLKNMRIERQGEWFSEGGFSTSKIAVLAKNVFVWEKDPAQLIFLHFRKESQREICGNIQAFKWRSPKSKFTVLDCARALYHKLIDI